MSYATTRGFTAIFFIKWFDLYPSQLCLDQGHFRPGHKYFCPVLIVLSKIYLAHEIVTLNKSASSPPPNRAERNRRQTQEFMARTPCGMATAEELPPLANVV